MTRTIVVIASIVAVISSILLPSVTFTTGTAQGSFNGNFTIVPAALLLILCLLTWRWRGIVWGVLALVGIYSAVVAPMAIYQVGKHIVDSIGSPDLTYGPASYSYGFYINLTAFAAIIAASIWDIVLKRRQHTITTAPA